MPRVACEVVWRRGGGKRHDQTPALAYPPSVWSDAGIRSRRRAGTQPAGLVSSGARKLRRPDRKPERLARKLAAPALPVQALARGRARLVMQGFSPCADGAEACARASQAGTAGRRTARRWLSCSPASRRGMRASCRSLCAGLRALPAGFRGLPAGADGQRQRRLRVAAARCGGGCSAPTSLPSSLPARRPCRSPWRRRSRRARN